MKKNMEFLVDWLESKGALIDGVELKVYWVKGKVMNDIYKLTNSNAYPDDLNILILDPDCYIVSRLVIKIYELGGRWFDDVVDNNLSREKIYS